MKKEQFVDSIKGILPSFSEAELNLPYRDTSVESIDLVTIRVGFEKLLGYSIPDKKWLEFTSLGSIIDFCIEGSHSEHINETVTKAGSKTQSVTINMPQMALEALSENWLFKEIGGIHWDKICEGLNQSSFNLKDDLGNRLYATFVRIKISCSSNLRAFKENEVLSIDGSIKRFGESMYFSEIELESNGHRIEGELMTTFSVRNKTDNTSLAKSQPTVPNNPVEQFDQLPPLGNQYRLLKKGQLTTLKTGQYEFEIKDEPIFEVEYELNPYYDLNGVNLLYFAAYPIINDVCEAKYFNQEMEFPGRWEQTFYTSYKDVFYYANCNIQETLIYRLTECVKVDDNSFKMQSILLRKSDMQVMAKIFTVKSRLDNPD